ncbi:MAG: o-succinylbenzoate--CoA ligase [Ignavibacterium sp.]|uniref:o-succinylbenzoate--CoA ligase n=1 Tax=Ignavibacterium sp. TaxID=2651167 RepID=UPI004049F405
MKEFLYKYSDQEELTAIRTDSGSISYKNLFELSDKIARNIYSILKTEQKYIPVLSSNSSDFIITTIALWNLGLVPVPLNTRWTEKEIRDVIFNNNFEIILFEKEFSEKVNSLEINKFCFDDLFNFNSESFQKRFNDEAVVIFTSGSSAQPKGVVHTFDSLVNSIHNGSKILNQNIGDRWLASLPFYHIGGFQIICRALSSGCEIIIPTDLRIESIKKSISKFNPTHISLVAAQLKRLIEEKTMPDQTIKVSLIGGGFSEDNLLLEAAQKGWNPVRVYGSTETASFVTAATAEEIISKPNTAGRAVENVKIKISSEGEILISTKSLFKNYLNDEQARNEKIKNDFYHSGDLGKIDENEYLYVEARRTDLIVTGGENVNPTEVENELLKIPAIKEACVFPIQDEYWGQIAAAALITDGIIDEEYLKDELKKNLAAFKIPKKFFFVDELPKTSLGKIEREKIRKMFS